MTDKTFKGCCTNLFQLHTYRLHRERSESVHMFSSDVQRLHTGQCLAMQEFQYGLALSWEKYKDVFTSWVTSSKLLVRRSSCSWSRVAICDCSSCVDSWISGIGSFKAISTISKKNKQIKNKKKSEDQHYFVVVVLRLMNSCTLLDSTDWLCLRLIYMCYQVLFQLHSIHNVNVARPSKIVLCCRK